MIANIHIDKQHPWNTKTPFNLTSRRPTEASYLIPLHLLARTSLPSMRLYSTKPKPADASAQNASASTQQKLTHLNQFGEAHMVPISSKEPTKRKAFAVCNVIFSNILPLPLIRENKSKKGDVLGVARIAGIMAAKKTSDLIPLCHPIAITHVSVELELSDDYEHESPADDKEVKSFGAVNIKAIVSCDGKTGVEMEALTAASTAALTVYDMCKAVDKGMRIEGLKVIRKEGGKSGTWVDGTHCIEE